MSNEEEDDDGDDESSACSIMRTVRLVRAIY